MNWTTHSAANVAFRHPADWTVYRDERADLLTFTVQSPGTAFSTITLLPGRPDQAEVLQAAVEAFEIEYDDVDVYDAAEAIGPYESLGKDVDFQCLEMTSHAELRSFLAGNATVLVVSQAADLDWKAEGDKITQMMHSLEIG